MLKPVAAVPGHLLEKFGGNTVESGRVGALVSEERIAGLEESRRQIESRWSAEPIESVSTVHDRVLVDSEESSRRLGSAVFKESTPFGIFSSGYGSRRRQQSQASGSEQWETIEERESRVGRSRLIGSSCGCFYPICG